MVHSVQQLLAHRKGQQTHLPRRRSESVLHDVALFIVLFAIAIIVSINLSRIHNDNNPFSVPLFILVVSLIARFTTGYVYGVAASLLGVFCVNYMFTYPYWEFDMSLSGYPLTFAAMLLVSICISTLTSQIKKHERMRMEAEMEKMRANLLRSVSHDLRTPLTSIVGSSSVLLEDEGLSPEQRRELVREINKDARWLARITENILSVTKFSGNQVVLRKEYEVVEEIVSSAIVNFRKNHSPVQFTVHKPEEILLAPMDATLIEQVLVNLFDNAVEHGETTTEITIDISESDNVLHMLISDNGAGIPEGVFPHLFDGQASCYNSHADDRRNMGIGLCVCQSIIRAHGGAITARNNEHGGACFEITMPAKEEGKNEQA